MLLAVIFMQ